MKKIIRTSSVLLLLILVLALMGCGQSNPPATGGNTGNGDSEASTEGSPNEGTPPEENPDENEPDEETPNDTSEKTVWESIKETGVITVGNSPDYEPFEYEDGQGNVIGFDVALLELICGELGIKYELVNISFENIETAVQTGQVNIGMSGFSITPERQQTFDFSTPYFSGGQAIAVNPDSGITTIADLEGKTITAGMGTSGMEAAEENIPDADVIGMDNYALAFMQLKNKGCDAAVADLPVVRKYAAKDGFLVLDEILSYEDNAILIKKGNDDLVEALNGAIQTLKDNGKIDVLIDEWFISEE